MEIRISELMNLYQDDSIRPAAGPVWDAERIKDLTMKKLEITKSNHTRRWGRVLLIAAAAVLALAGTAVAVHHLTLEQRLVEEPDTEYIFEQVAVENPSGEMETQTVLVTAAPSSRTSISVQGQASSPESRAYLAWMAYKEQWSLDNPNWSDAYGGDDSYYETPENYAHLYGAFLQEQAEVLDGIAETYSLTLHERREGFDGEEELCAMLGCEEFFPAAVTGLGGYCFDDGSFKADGRWGRVGLCLVTTRAGSFSVIGGLDPSTEWFGDYEEWSLSAEDGTELLLILGDYRAQVLAQLPGAALTLNVYAGRLGENPNQPETEKELYAIDAEGLEELALSMDYEILASCYETERDISANMDAVLSAPEEEAVPTVSEYGVLNEWIVPWERDEAQNTLVFERLGLYEPAVLPMGAVSWFTASDVGFDAGDGRVVKTWMIPENLDTKTEFDIFLRYESVENFKSYHVLATDEMGEVIESEILTGWPAAKEQMTGLASADCVSEELTIRGFEGVKTVREDGTIEGLIWYDEEAGLVFWMVNSLPDLSADEFLAMAESMGKQ